VTSALKARGVALGADALIALRQVALSARRDPALAALPGGFATRRKGQGLEVADTREYVVGDDFRRLDFGTTARTGVLHVRQFQEERDRITLLVADFRPAMLWGIRRAFRSVVAAEILSVIGWNVVESGGRVGLLAVLPDKLLVVPARGRARGMLDVIGGLVEGHDTALRRVQAGWTGDPPLAEALLRVDRLVPSGAEMVMASGFDSLGGNFEDRIEDIARRRVPRLIHVTDAVGMSLPKGRYPIRLPDGTRHHIRKRQNAGGTAESQTWIAGHAAMIVDAGQPVEVSAARVASAFAPERRP
jgi:hypothetical protein